MEKAMNNKICDARVWINNLRSHNLYLIIGVVIMVRAIEYLLTTINNALTESLNFKEFKFTYLLVCPDRIGQSNIISMD